MADSFGSVMGQRLLFWSGWFFTVFGVIVGLYLSKEYAWIGILIAVGGLLPLGTHAAWVHKRLGEAEQRHQKELEEYRQLFRDEVRRREAAEQQLAGVPVEALSRLATLVSEGVVNELVGLLRQQADLVSRLRLFLTSLAKPLVVRSFPLLQNENYVVARGSVEALRHLRPGDPFVLLRRNEAGVEITVARLRVHQPTASGEDLVYFQVVRTTTEDVAHLSGLTGVVGIKGYTLAMGIELDGIPAMDFAQVAEAIPYLAAGLTRIRGS